MYTHGEGYGGITSLPRTGLPTQCAPGAAALAELLVSGKLMPHAREPTAWLRSRLPGIRGGTTAGLADLVEDPPVPLAAAGCGAGLLTHSAALQYESSDTRLRALCQGSNQTQAPVPPQGQLEPGFPTPRGSGRRWMQRIPVSPAGSQACLGKACVKSPGCHTSVSRISKCFTRLLP